MLMSPDFKHFPELGDAGILSMTPWLGEGDPDFERLEVHGRTSLDLVTSFGLPQLYQGGNNSK